MSSEITPLRFSLLILSSIHVSLMFNFHMLYFSLIFIWDFDWKYHFFSKISDIVPGDQPCGSYTQHWLEITFLFYSSKHLSMLSHKHYAAQTGCLYSWACYCHTIHLRFTTSSTVYIIPDINLLDSAIFFVEKFWYLRSKLFNPNCRVNLLWD